MPFTPFRRDDHVRQFFADHILAAIAECLFRRLIEADDFALMVDRDDAVKRCSQYCALELLAFDQGRFEFSDRR
jgi:hypothetical protein